MRKCGLMVAMLVVLVWASSACGVVKMPFRVVGSVASHTYQAGKRAVTKDEKPKAPAKPDDKTKPAAAATSKILPQPPPPGPKDPEPPADPRVPVPPPNLPEMPGDILPPLPEELPPL